MSSSLQLLGRGTCTVFQPSPLASLLSTRLALLPFFVDVSVLWLLHVLSWCACCSVSSSLCNKMEGRHRGCFHFLGCLFARGSPPPLPLCLSRSFLPSPVLSFFFSTPGHAGYRANRGFPFSLRWSFARAFSCLACIYHVMSASTLSRCRAIAGCVSLRPSCVSASVLTLLVCPSIYICLCQPMYSPISPSACMSVYLSTCLLVYVALYLPISIPACPT